MSAHHPVELRAPAARLTRALIAATMSVMLVAGCGGGGSDEANAADRSYSADVVAHHAQTLALLDLTLGRDALDPRIGAFADQARSETFAEVHKAQGRLKAWGEKVPKTSLEHTHDEAGAEYDTSIAGVMSSDEVHKLESTKGEAFQEAWVRQLIAHEQGAVKVASAAIAEGQDTVAVAAARQDRKAHMHRIALLEDLLAS